MHDWAQKTAVFFTKMQKSAHVDPDPDQQH